MTPFQAYVDYLAVKTHFTSETYDYFRYSGKVVAKVSTFERRKDRNRFEKLARKEDVSLFLASNIARNPAVWIGDLVSEDGDSHDNYSMARKFIDSFGYVVKDYIRALPEKKFIDNFSVQKDGIPAVKLLKSGKLPLEFVATLDAVMGFTKHQGWFDSRDPTVVQAAERVSKYAPFMRKYGDMQKLAASLKEVYDADGNRID